MMDKLDKRTIEILEKILKVLENAGDDINWNKETSRIKEKDYFLN
ncbi:hypothetical protein [Crassaminicella profunda]|nr:hypothetical protein [Crassaminicella profunda]